MQKLLQLIAALLLSVNMFAGTIPVSNWLIVSGPEMIMPAFSETENIDGEPFTAKELFEFNPVDIAGHYPGETRVFMISSDLEKRWETAEANDSGFVTLPVSGNSKYSTSYLAAYIAADRWMEAELVVRSRQRLEVYLNGKRVGSKSSLQKADDDPGTWKYDAELTTGKHLLMIRAFHESENGSKGEINAKFNLPSYAAVDDIAIELEPEQGKNINHLLDGIKAGSASLSPDGKLYAVNFSRTLPPSDNSENWMEIKRVSDGKTVHSFRHATVSSFSWTPEAGVISYRTNRDGKATIQTYDLDNGKYNTILEDIENFGSYSWSPDGSFLIYTISEEMTGNEGAMKRVEGMQDRLPQYRTRHFLYMADVNTGVRERLTHGYLTTSLHDISPCSRKILFSQTRPDYLERPYSKQNLFLLDLDSRQADTLLKDKRWSISGTFSPDGKRILFTGGPSAFSGAGENIPEGMIANNYDTQAYIYDLESGNTDPFTKEFDPSVSQALWSKADNLIYIRAGEGEYVNLFRYNTRNRRFAKIDTGEDVVNWVRLADNEPMAIYAGSGISSPPKISLLNLKNDRFRMLENPESENFRHVVFGDNFDWDFTTSGGINIPGRVYLPPDFDKAEKYPLIVYYYGGTNPVSRSFGGRYPYNMYAANGYVVYVLQPSGATGFGQEFSARHVNNWGITVADEIIEGTGLFIDDHPFIDPDRIGCMGASYGGFMTMLLQTRTDMFAAAISHAGISSISSYWGEGYWGYGYSAEASAGSFPWNNRELYVEQSPLFSADRITTPLLLLHGDSDTNVPPGESIQLYVALKLLGRPVELVKIEGENHHILTYSKRIAWSNTKLAWFDKWLKNQPQWWNNLYPEKNL